MYKTAPKEVIEARPLAIRFAKEINEFCEKKWPENSGFMATLTGSLVLQNFITSIMVEMFEPGSAEGEAALRDFYAHIIKDAVERWHEADLKHYFKHRHDKRS